MKPLCGSAETTYCRNGLASGLRDDRRRILAPAGGVGLQIAALHRLLDLPSLRLGMLTPEKLPLVVALVLGLLAGAVAFWGIKKKEAEVRQGWNLVPVVVATRDLREGTLVTREMMAQRPIPEQFVTTSVVKPDLASYLENQKLLVPVQAGDPFLWTQFETINTGDRLSSKIQRRGRVITIDASMRSAVGGWIRPNDHVDVIGTFKDPRTSQQVAMTLLQNVIVLATGKLTGAGNGGAGSEAQREYNNVSLLVLPEEAEILTLAGELGGLTMVLRNEDDIETLFEDRSRTTLQTLISGERTKTLQEKRQQSIQIIRGSTSEKALVGSRAH